MTGRDDFGPAEAGRLTSGGQCGHVTLTQSDLPPLAYEEQPGEFAWRAIPNGIERDMIRIPLSEIKGIDFAKAASDHRAACEAHLKTVNKPAPVPRGVARRWLTHCID